jgi:BirA family biotin operon repressor/biotin-[acetyl-CoA-carboxylase] ligase
LEPSLEKLDAEKIIATIELLTPPEIIVEDITGSLMDDATESAVQSQGPSIVLVAEEQTAGRGRRNRPWESARSLGLYMAVVLSESRIGRVGGVLSLIAGLAACEAIKAVGNVNAAIKWPNDIMVMNRKIAGILIEKPACVPAVIIGIGVNVHHRLKDFSAELEKTATSIYIETGRDVSRNVVAGHLFTEILSKIDEFHKGAGPTLLNSYKQACETLGTEVKITDGPETCKGTAVDVSDDGALVLKTVSGKRKIYAGDIKPIS